MSDTRDTGPWPKLLPELTSAALFALIAAGIGAHWYGASLQDALTLFVAAELGTWMLMCTLIDVATRLRRPPPPWLGIAIVAGLCVLYPHVFTMLGFAWSVSAWVFFPLAWSIVERMRELWTLPRASVLEKQRRRALTFGRLYTGLAFAGAFVVVMLIAAATSDDQSFPAGLPIVLLPWLMLAFHLIAAYDAWRVHRPAFAKRPRSLWPMFDHGDVERLDPL